MADFAFEGNLTYNEAVQRNKTLRELSIYDICDGDLTGIKDDDIPQFEEDVCKRFNYYKRLVQLGEYTYEEMIEYIVNKHAIKPLNNNKVNLSTDDGIKKLFEFCEMNVEIIEVNSKPIFSDAFSDAIKNIQIVDIDKHFERKSKTKSIKPKKNKNKG